MGKKDTVTFEEFKEEIELTDKQYGQEEDLYFLVNKIIRSTLPDNMTVRDVHILQKPPESKEFQGREHFIAYGQAPDFVILDKEFKQSEKNQSSLVYGCVEIKQFKKSDDFDTIKDKIIELKKKEKKSKNKESVLESIEEKKKKVNNEKGEENKEKQNNEDNKPVKKYIMTIGEETETISNKVSELIRECIFFKKVLFTNLKQWYFLEYKGKVEKKEENVEKYTISMSKIKIKKLYNYSVYDSEKQGKVRFAKFLAELDDINWK